MNNRAEAIKNILYEYVEQKSITESKGEKDAEKFFINYFSKQEYFKNNRELVGTFPIKEDPYNRAVSWAMVRGQGRDTVVLIHHNDVVSVENYKLLKELAFLPDQLEEKLIEIKDSFSSEVKEDLESGKYLYGRGVCDMKGGGSIQIALLSEYSKIKDFKGNVIVLGLPDEENLSAGMRTAITLLGQLKDRFDLNYKLMINSEPHQRKNYEEGVFSLGSIGKVMPYVSIRGFLSHAGKVFEGLNPSNVMAEIVRKTEVNMDFSDTINGEVAPPPTWLYMRDDKLSYDVSMPLTVNGCLSILTLNQNPNIILEKLKKICIDSFDNVINDMNKNYKIFLKSLNQEERKLPWKTKVVYFEELCKEAEENYGEKFNHDYEDFINQLKTYIYEGKYNLINANFKLVDFVYEYIHDLSPRIVIGLVPPYYPYVSNLFYDGSDNKISNIYNVLSAFVRDKYDQKYIKEYFYTGISDLSYSYIYNGDEIEKSLSSTMPFWGKIYHLPIKDIENVSMPCINIGPWGKDFHKMTERVYKEDLFYRTPEILDYTIKYILG